MGRTTVYLMYHEIESPGRALVDAEPGYTLYVVGETSFRAQLGHLGAGGYRVSSVAEALGGGGGGAGDDAGPAVVLTFDDGCETDFGVAAPLLAEAGYGATFYVTAGNVGRRGYLSAGQVRALGDMGFDVGCHSMTHSFLTDLGEDRLRAEVAGAKEMLEQMTGRRVANFSCPGGRWSERVARAARAAGYESVATSRIGANAPGSDPFRLSRVAVMQDTGAAEFARLCRGEGLFKRRAKAAALDLAKRALGNTAYERFRAAVLGQKPEASG